MACRSISPTARQYLPPRWINQSGHRPPGTPGEDLSMGRGWAPIARYAFQRSSISQGFVPYGSRALPQHTPVSMAAWILRRQHWASDLLPKNATPGLPEAVRHAHMVELLMKGVVAADAASSPDRWVLDPAVPAKRPALLLRIGRAVGSARTMGYCPSSRAGGCRSRSVGPE